MKKSILFILGSLLFTLISCDDQVTFTEAKVFKGNVFLNDQQSLDEFGALGYEGIDGDLTIGAVDNLEALSTLQTVGNLTIGLTWNDDNNNGIIDREETENVLVPIQNFEGLHNLKNISGRLSIGNTFNVVNLQGFNSLRIASGSLTLYNLNVESFEGLETLEEVDYLDIYLCHNLKSLNGFQGLKKVRTLWIDDNDNLESLVGLENLITVESNLWIEDCPKLVSLEPLSSVTSSVSNIRIQNNLLITSLAGLENISAGSNPQGRISDNAGLSDFCALNHLTSFNNNFTISGNKYDPTTGEVLSQLGTCSQ